MTTIEERYEQVLKEFENYVNSWIEKQGSEELLQHARVENLINIRMEGRHEIQIKYTGIDGNCYEYWETAKNEGLSVCDEPCEEGWE